jgi:uncharacterized membrane protein|tara:strand:- start:128 stop:610 length:483 start_codon:yes stop_codon:yes gene_type:complete
MESFDQFVVARIVHILAVVMWIGGVAFVTTVLIPSLRSLEQEDNRLQLFERLEGRFGFQAKITTLLTGLSGLWMLDYLNAWSRYLDPQFWWIHLMTAVWFIFTLVLFVLEPLFLHKFFHQLAEKDSDSAFKKLHIMHIVLLSISLLAIAAAMAGAHGLSF